MKPVQYQSSHTPLTTELLKRYALILLTECDSGSANYLREQIRLAGTKADLLQLRSAMFECMSVHLGEAEAMERTRSLDLCA